MGLLGKVRHFCSDWITRYRKRQKYSRRIAISRTHWTQCLADTSTNWQASGMLSDDQKKEIAEIWAGRYRPPEKLTFLYHEFYFKATGRFDANYFPDDLFYSLFDRLCNNSERAKVLDNKCLYSRLFPTAKMPETIASRLQGTWLNEANESISISELSLLLIKETEIVFKLANGSWGGKGVFFLQGDSMAEEALKLCNQVSNDIILQRPIRQHPALAAPNPESVNTIRHISYLSDGKAKVYSSILRMGVNGSRVDNASSGGITCGITENGRLKQIAYSPNGRHYDVHPTTGIHFDTIVVPSFQESVSFVQKLHESLPLFKLISWDITIDPDGLPVLIEANLAGGELDFHQLNNGPLFGADQDRILSEINWDIPNYQSL